MYSELWNKYLSRGYVFCEIGTDPTLERKQVTINWYWSCTIASIIPIDALMTLLTEAKSYGVTDINISTSYQEDCVDFCTTSHRETDAELVTRIRHILTVCRNNEWLNPAIVQPAVNAALYETERASIDFKYGRISKYDFDKTWEQLSTIQQNRDEAEQKLSAAKAAWAQLQEMGLVAANNNGE